MIRKLLIMICSTVSTYAGIIGTDYSPATSVSSSSFSTSPVFAKTIEAPIVEKTQEIVYERPELSPIYESVVNTQDNKYENEDGSEHRSFSKSLNTGDLSISKFEARTTKDGTAYSVPSFSAPLYTEAIYKSGNYDHISTSPVVYTSSAHINPVTYISQVNPVTQLAKSLPSYSIGASPVIYNTKVYPGLSAFASRSVDHASTSIKSHILPEGQLKSITYSNSPVVSHVTFSGSEASYSW